MASRNPDPMKVNPDTLTPGELKIHFEVLRERYKNQEAELARLKSKPIGKTLLKMLTSIVISLLMLFSGLLYTYAINKLTGTPPDSGAETLLGFAVWIYVISIVLQLINAGGS